MASSFHATVAAYRRWWLPDLLVLVALAVAVTLLFWWTDLDVLAAAPFYGGGPAGEPWPMREAWLWWFFFYAAPYFTMAMLVLGGAMLIRGWLDPRRRVWRIYGLFIILVVVTGPGLVVNAIMKEYTGRPRPRQIEQFGGHLEHVPPLAIGEIGRGKSFPAGHASVGFATCALYFLLRRRRPRLAWAALGSSVSLGLLMGVGRMAAGGHFLSDVLWAGMVVFATALVLYYFVLRVPLWEDLPPRQAAAAMRPRRPVLTAVCIGMVVSVLCAAALLATPANREVNWQYQPEGEAIDGREVRLHLDRADLTLVLTDAGNPVPVLSLTGRIRGFGPPTSRLREHRLIEQRDGRPLVAYELRRRGWFTELNGEVQAQVNIEGLSRLQVRVDEGDIRIIDRTDGTRDFPEFDIRSRHGRIEHLLPRWAGQR